MIATNRTDLFGTWVGRSGDLVLQLRVDLGATGALDILSGDLAEVTPEGTRYLHSFRTTHLEEMANTGGVQTLSGPSHIFDKGLPYLTRVDLVIPATGNIDLTYSFYQLTEQGRQSLGSATFDLGFAEDSLRQVDLEFDLVSGVSAPVAFDPGTGPVTFDNAFADAGVNLIVSGPGGVAPSAAGLDGRWTSEELHAAMESNFALHTNDPQWRLYMLLATEYVIPSVLGIMFDSDDEAPRQGAAVFADHPALSATAVDHDREFLHTVVHELGHAFNLLHSFQKNLFHGPDRHARPGSPSWMNYPDLFPFGYARPDKWNGSELFWSQFDLSFDRTELEHLRHFHALGVMMGGEEFGGSGHRSTQPFEPVRTDDELEFMLWVPPVVEFLELVEGDVRLTNTGREEIGAAATLVPEAGQVTLLIQRPGSAAPQVHGGIARTCTRGDEIALAPKEAIYADIMPSVDRHGWNIDEPGTYLIQAIYDGPTGRRLASPIQSVHVSVPNRVQERLGSNLFTRSVARYLGLEGSRADSLAAAADILDEIAERLPQTALARQARLTKAHRDCRVFKDVGAERVRHEGRKDAAARFLGEVAPRDQVIPAATQSHLRLGRQLNAAAQTYAREPEEFEHVISIQKGFLDAVGAPDQAHAELGRFAEQAQAD